MRMEKYLEVKKGLTSKNQTGISIGRYKKLDGKTTGEDVTGFITSLIHHFTFSTECPELIHLPVRPRLVAQEAFEQGFRL